MKQLLSTLILVFVFASAQAQSPYVSISSAGLFDHNAIEIGGAYNNAVYTIGVSGDDGLKTASLGADYFISPITFGDFKPFASVGIRGFYGEFTDQNIIVNSLDPELTRTGTTSKVTDAGSLARVGLGFEVPVGSSFVRLSTSLEQRFITHNELYWVPVNIGFRL